MFSQYISTCNSPTPLDQCQIFDTISFSAIQDSGLGILITPVCDIARPETKLDYLNFCAVLPYEKLFLSVLKEKYNVDEDTFKKEGLNSKNLNDFINNRLVRLLNNQITRFHWIGELPKRDGFWYVDYQLVQSVSFNCIDKIMAYRVASIKSPLKESIFVRFSNYLGRVGLIGEGKERKEYAKHLYDTIKNSRN